MRVISVARHHLVGIGEVAVIAVGPGRDPGGDGGIELRRVYAPLLAGIATEKLAVEILTDLADDRVGVPHVSVRAPGDPLHIALRVEELDGELLEAAGRCHPADEVVGSLDEPEPAVGSAGDGGG